MAACKGCGKAIVWGFTGGNTRIPLEKLHHGYIGLHTPYPVEGEDFPITKPPVQVFISHFLTCPNANKFSGKNKPKASDMTVQSETRGPDITEEF